MRILYNTYTLPEKMCCKSSCMDSVMLWLETIHAEIQADTCYWRKRKRMATQREKC